MTSVSSAPKGKEHFQSDRADVIVTAMVREVTQNALDARDILASGPVTVRFSARSIPAAQFKERFMRGLDLHMEAARAAAKSNADIDLFAGIDFDDDVKALLVEDYNTTGLRGGIDQDHTNHEFHNFVSFWLRQGVSSKKGGSGGRHGVGKGTLSESSNLRTIFGVTHRVDAPNLVGYGQSSLYPHHIGRDQHSAFGMFGQVEDGHAWPMTGETALALSRDAGFDREGKNGFSVLIPYLKAEVTEEALVREVIMQTYCQICLGQLVVQVGDVVIDRTTIQKLASAGDATSSLVPSIKAAILASVSTDHEVFSVQVPEGRRSVSRDLVSDDVFQRMRDTFEAGNLVDLRVLVPIRKVRSADNPSPQVQWGEFRAALMKTEEGTRGAEVFTRGSVTVYQLPSKGDYVGMVMAHLDDVLSKFLGDSEDVSHTKWTLSRVKQTERGYVNEYADNAMGCVKDFFKALGADIAGVNKPRNLENALTDVLYYTRKEQVGEPRVKKVEKVAVAEIVPAIDPAKKSPVTMSKTTDGFKLYRNPDVEGDKPFSITLGYCGRNRKLDYDRADFVLGEFPISIVKTGEVECRPNEDGNVLLVGYMAPGSSISVGGFDTNRQLVIKTGRKKV